MPTLALADPYLVCLPLHFPLLAPCACHLNSGPGLGKMMQVYKGPFFHCHSFIVRLLLLIGSMMEISRSLLLPLGRKWRVRSYTIAALAT